MTRSSAMAMALFSMASLLVGGGVALVGCDDEGSEGVSASDGAVAIDLFERAHLADVQHRGLFVDFGTPQQNKYTVGDWESGWLSRGVEGSTTFAHAGRRARVFFHADEPGAMAVRLRLKPIGTGALTPYVNGEQIPSVFFDADTGFVDVDFQLPGEHVRKGENQLLLTFGGAELIGSEEVSVAIASLRIGSGSRLDDDGFIEPTWDRVHGHVTIDEERRSAMVLRGPAKLSWYLEIPDGEPTLSFGVAHDGKGVAETSVVITTEDGQASTVFTAPVEAAWNDQRVDLGAYAGEIVRLDLVATDETDGRVVWSRPRVVGRPAEPRSSERAKNVVVVLIDTLRADKLQSINRESRVRAPTLNRLAEEGSLFTAAQSTENWTKPSVAAVLTGLYPRTHGARTQQAVLSEDALLLSEHLKEQGFQTASFIANGYVSDRFGFDQGWDKYRNFIREEVSSDATNVFGEASEWAREHKDERFFLYVQTIDPHVAYDPGDEYLRMYDDRDYQGPVEPRRTPTLLEDAKRGRITFSESDATRLEALHDGEITQHDVELEKFLKGLGELGVLDDTLVVVVSDHGEEFDDHGSWGHGHSIYQELLHVPFLFHLPGVVPERRVESAVSTVDLAPTVVDLLGVPPLPSAEGHSLVSLMHGGSTQGPERGGPPIAFSDFLDERRVAVAGDWKLVVRGNLTASLFHLATDPSEEEQLELYDHPIAARYLRVLQGQFLGATDRARWLDSEQGPGVRLRGGDARMDSQLQGQLEALGYIN